MPEASGNGRGHQSWGLGYRLPLSGQGSLGSGSEQERPSPPILRPGVTICLFQTRVGGVWKRVEAPVATSLGVLVTICTFADKVAGVRKRVGTTVAGSFEVLVTICASAICPFLDKGRWCSEASRNGRGHQSWVLLTICPFPDKGRWCLEASRSGRCHQSWVLGYHLRICPFPDTGR